MMIGSLPTCLLDQPAVARIYESGATICERGDCAAALDHLSQHQAYDVGKASASCRIRVVVYV